MSQSDIWNQTRIVELVLVTLIIFRVIHKYVLVKGFRPFKIACVGYTRVISRSYGS